MENHKIAVILPSRGLIFAEVIAYIENVRSTYPDIRVFTSSNLPIPECFNTLVEQALLDERVSYLWFIEEDTVPPDMALDKFLSLDGDIAAVDYGFNGGWNTVVRSSTTGEILFTGMGCTFIKRKVFEALPKPYFRADKAFDLGRQTWYDADPHKVYGMYDILFGATVREKGFVIQQVEGECRHLQLQELGQKEVNAGCHIITEKSRISRKILI